MQSKPSTKEEDFFFFFRVFLAEPDLCHGGSDDDELQEHNGEECEFQDILLNGFVFSGGPGTLCRVNE